MISLSLIYSIYRDISSLIPYSFLKLLLKLSYLCNTKSVLLPRLIHYNNLMRFCKDRLKDLGISQRISWLLSLLIPPMVHLVVCFINSLFFTLIVHLCFDVCQPLMIISCARIESFFTPVTRQPCLEASYMDLPVSSTFGAQLSTRGIRILIDY